MARIILLAYIHFNKEFKIHTNPIYPQLVAVIIQEVKTIAFCSRKLTKSKNKYTVTEQELLRIVKNLKALRTILLGQKLKYIITIKSYEYIF